MTDETCEPHEDYLSAVVFAVNFLLELNAHTRFVSFADIEKALATAAVLYPSVARPEEQMALRGDLNFLIEDFGPQLISESEGKRGEIIRGALR